MANTEKKSSSGCKSKSILLLMVALIFVCGMCTICGIVAAATDWLGLFDSVSEDDTVEAVNEYLGFEVASIDIDDYESFNQEAFDFYENMGTLAQLEITLSQAAENADPEAFFDAYESYNQTAGTLIGQAQAMSAFMEKDTTAARFRLVQPVYAKERSSWWYYVPIIGSLVRAKHQSIETSRAGIYDYMKNDLESVDRDAFLKEYNLDSIEDIRNASDDVVENLARDPELRSGIDWTKVGTDLAEHACQAVSESYKIGPSKAPELAIGVNAGFRYALKWAKPVGDEIEPVDTPTVVAVLPEDTITAIDDAMGSDVGNDFEDFSSDSIAALNDPGDYTIQDHAITKVATRDGEEFIDLDAGEYQITIVVKGNLPVTVNDVEVQEGKVATAEIPVVTLSEYALDPEIAKTLGFSIDIIQEDFVVTACSDLGPIDSFYEYEARRCKNDYENCQEAPYTIPTESSSEYIACTGSDGGCWDMHRWVHVESCGSCPFDNEGTLDYSHNWFQDDFEYFPESNLAFCECCVDCWLEYSVEQDCYTLFESCCQQYIEEE